MELSPNECKVLLTLGQLGREAALDDLRTTGLQQTTIMSAASWLASKGLVEVRETPTTYYSLTSEGRADLEGRLPLERVVSGMSLKELMVSLQGTLTPQVLNFVVGYLKRSGSLKEGVVELSVEARQYVSDGRSLLELLSSRPLPTQEIPSPLAPIIPDYDKRGLIKGKERVVRTLSITKGGKRALKLVEAMEEEITQLTPKIIQSGAWRTTPLAKYDIHTFAPTLPRGRSHPITSAISRLRRIFLDMGFTELAGPFVEPCFWDMDALFVPQDHPARDLQDTFYVEAPSPKLDQGLIDKVKGVHESGGDTGSRGWGYQWSEEETKKLVLRTHTTADTIRYLSRHPEPPVKAFCIGRIFRREAVDAKHLPEFYQIEGIVMEEGANLEMLIGLLEEFYRRMGLEIGIRPAYFPYTEPSLEVVTHIEGKEMELGGAGIFRPEVTAPFNISCPVLAWGLGLERLLMLQLGVQDIRELYANDLDWLRRH